MRTRRLEYLSFAQQLQAVYEGHVTFDRFIQATRETWRRYALYLLRRWRPPCSVDVADMEQELILAAWHALSAFEPGRTTLKKFVVFSACDKAKKWLHKQRDAYRRDDKAPSRAALNFTQLGCETEADVERFFGEDLDTIPEVLVLARAEQFATQVRWNDAALVLTDQQRCIARIIADCGGDLADATDTLKGDPTLRISFKLASDEAVARIVRDTARATMIQYTDIEQGQSINDY